jgi:beta-N-acetylhexosaminidase
LNQKQRTAATRLIGVLTLCVCSVPIWLLPSRQPAPTTATAATRQLAASALSAGPLLAPTSSAVDRGAYPGAPAGGSDSPPPPGEIRLSFLVGQLVMAGMDGTQPDAELLRQAREGEIGGVLLFSSNVSPGLPAAMQSLQEAARQGDDPPLLVATDQEGGSVKRLPGPPRSPQLIDSEPLAESEGAATGSLLVASHVNVDLAPVADVVSPGGFEARQGRGFPGGPDRVAALATAFAGGLQRRHVAATAKHFPGIGSLALDTDHTLGQLQLSPAAMQDQLVPFKRLIDHGVDLVMLANAVCPVWDAARPAVFSRNVAEGLLRHQLGFSGVVITDDLEAQSLQGDLGERAVQAVEAGADVVLFGSAAGGRAAYRALLAAAQAGRLSGPRLLESYRRLRGLKASLAT